MDRFLIFFQQYIYTKQYIFMDLEFMLLDTFEGLRTKNFPKVDSLQQSNVACRRIRQAEAYYYRAGGVSSDGCETVQDVINSCLLAAKPNLKQRQLADDSSITARVMADEVEADRVIEDT